MDDDQDNNYVSGISVDAIPVASSNVDIPEQNIEQSARTQSQSEHVIPEPSEPTVNDQRQMDAIVVVERLNTIQDILGEVAIVNDSSDGGVQNEASLHVETNAGPIVTSPPSSKKRKRSKSATPPKKLNCSIDDEDGATCPVCLDHWEMSGPHRLTSLKCGHLFGLSCIKRWLNECSPRSRCCPTCKTKATFRDMRHLYAKKVCAVDKTEEHRLRELLEAEQRKNSRLQEDYSIVKFELAVAKTLVTKLQGDVERLKKIGACGEAPSSRAAVPAMHYKLFMEKNIEISKEPGCRVLLFGKNSGNLIVSQRSTQTLFPGYGMRFIDTKTFKPTHFLHTSVTPVRDLCFNSTEDLVVSATMEKTAKLFNIRDRTVVSVFTPSDRPLWACAIDKEISNFLYLGSQHGTTYVYDVRYPSTVVEEFKNEGDVSPVIKVCPVPTSNTFPFGGFLVCKLQSIWFYEKVASQEIVPNKLNVDGPFISMSYDASTNIVLISTRPSSKHIHSRYIVASLIKANEIVVLDTSVTFFGSKVTPVMSRCTQIPVKDNTLIAAYLQDVKLLSMWDLRESCRIQSLPVTDVVLDTCPVYDKDTTYLAALTETKCRIYKVISSD